MSSRLATCAACGRLGLHTELTEEQSAALYKLVNPDQKSKIAWRIRTLICQACGRPVIALWPFDIDRDKVLLALGVPPESLHTPEKESRR